MRPRSQLRPLLLLVSGAPEVLAQERAGVREHRRAHAVLQTRVAAERPGPVRRTAQLLLIHWEGEVTGLKWLPVIQQWLPVDYHPRAKLFYG